MATLTVGSGKQYATINAAVKAAASGDTVAVTGGTYTNDFIYVNKSLTLEAVDGMVKLVATSSPANGKAAIITGVKGVAMTINISGFEVSGVKVADQNGAAIRYEGGTLNLTDVYFHHNQEGILGGNVAGGAININHSEFAYNGTTTGKSHNIYIGQIEKFTLTNSYVHDAIVGHEVKSRALNNTITGNRIFDNNGTASYSIDLPWAGNATIANNTIEQGAKSENAFIFAYGAEGGTNPGRNISISNNTIVDDRANGRGTLNKTTTAVKYTNNREWHGGADQGPIADTGTVVLTTRPSLDTSAMKFIIPKSTPTTPTPTMTLAEYRADLTDDFYAWALTVSAETLHAATPIYVKELTSPVVLTTPLPGDVWSN